MSALFYKHLVNKSPFTIKRIKRLLTRPLFHFLGGLALALSLFYTPLPSALPEQTIEIKPNS